MILNPSKKLKRKLAKTTSKKDNKKLEHKVVKATSKKKFPPKKKHLNSLVQYTKKTDALVHNLAACLMKRMKHCNWIVAYKALLTVHYLIKHGNETFISLLSADQYNFNHIQLASKLGNKGLSHALI